MMKRTTLLLLMLLSAHFIPAQENNSYKEGYALKGKDTIHCKLLLDTRNDDPLGMISLLVDGEAVNFFPGGPITGFGMEEHGHRYDYGVVDAERVYGNRSITSLLYIKKMVAGTIDLYEDNYSVNTVVTRTTYRDGIEQPGSTSSSNSKKTTNYYIAKKDSLNPGLAKAVILPSFKKKDLEKYIGDNVTIMNRPDKRYTMKELIAVLKEYNDWSINKSN